MAETESASPPPAGTGEGIAPVTMGQAAAQAAASTPPSPADQPGPTAARPDQPQAAGDSGLGWKSLTDAERDYKHLQGAFTKATQVLASLGDPRAVQQRLQLLESLQADPDFVQWAQARVAQAQTGSADPDTVKALEIVDQRAEAKARAMVEEAIGPLYAAHLEQKRATVWAEMDKAHGPDWQQYKAAMKTIHQQDMQRGLVSPEAEQAFDYDYVNGLFARAVAADPNYHARQYQKRLAEKQANATEPSPGTAPSAVGSGGRPKSIAEAAAMARKQLGWA